MGVFDDVLATDADAPEENPEGQADAPQAEGPVQGQPSEAEALAEEEGTQDQEQQQPILGKFKTYDEVVRAYQELERKLGARDEEKENLRGQVAFLTQYLQTVLPQQAPVQPQAQEPQGAQPQEDEDPDKWLERFYAEGPKAIDARVEKRLQELEQRIVQALVPVQQHMTQDHYNRQALALAAKYPDFKDLAPKMMQVYEQYPMLAVMPNGMELAYQAVKSAEVQKQAASETSAAVKAGARLPASSGMRPGKQPTPEDLIRQSVFGGSESQGIFG